MPIIPSDLKISRISVIIPCYNAADYLEATLRSVINQDDPNVEVVLADGNSTDGTLEIARQATGLLVNIISEPDRGQLDALQKGIAIASGDILLWLNADDIVMPNAFRDVREAFRDEKVDFVYSDDVAFDEDIKVVYFGATIKGLNDWDHFLFYRQLYSECVYWRREVTRYLPPSFFDLRVYSDYAFFLNLRWGRRGRWVSQRLGAFRIRPGQSSAVFKERKMIEYMRIKQTHMAKIGITPIVFHLMRIAYWPWFALRHKLIPAVHRGTRKGLRILTRDSNRKMLTRIFFDEWLLRGGSHH